MKKWTWDLVADFWWIVVRARHLRLVLGLRSWRETASLRANVERQLVHVAHLGQNPLNAAERERGRERFAEMRKYGDQLAEISDCKLAAEASQFHIPWDFNREGDSVLTREDRQRIRVELQKHREQNREFRVKVWGVFLPALTTLLGVLVGAWLKS